MVSYRNRRCDVKVTESLNTRYATERSEGKSPACEVESDNELMAGLHISTVEEVQNKTKLYKVDVNGLE